MSYKLAQLMIQEFVDEKESGKLVSDFADGEGPALEGVEDIPKARIGSPNAESRKRRTIDDEILGK